MKAGDGGSWKQKSPRTLLFFSRVSCCVMVLGHLRILFPVAKMTVSYYRDKDL